MVIEKPQKRTTYNLSHEVKWKLLQNIPVITYKPSQPAHHLVKMGINVSSCIPTKASGTSMVTPIGSDPSHTGQTINGGSDSIGESDIGSLKDCQTTVSFNSTCESTSEAANTDKTNEANDEPQTA